ncbi:hypothetical protein QOZ98_000068 [Planomicrobium stackebrandtii]|uniref:Lipoprotein n=1 Tax=Planomicrobium stackebrandtii TaxID=253160 RepID=A0ABU0GPL6_9BACL|nr:hypothetical protein [Planomicrobium stackebrandtii]MDQ0427243.1 hypothetical protein [Planomicrobium stackebrandtii]
MKSKTLYLSSIITLLLAGCVQENQVIGNDNSNSIENTDYVSQKPPHLKVRINEEDYSAGLSGYEWNYFDQEENMMATVQTESISPFDLVGNREAPAVNSETSIQFRFEEEPLFYQVNIWDAKNTREASSNVVALEGQSGRTIYEVAATWEQGTGHYFFPLTVE